MVRNNDFINTNVDKENCLVIINISQVDNFLNNQKNKFLILPQYLLNSFLN